MFERTHDAYVVVGATEKSDPDDLARAMLGVHQREDALIMRPARAKLLAQALLEASDLDGFVMLGLKQHIEPMEMGVEGDIEADMVEWMKE